MIRHDINKKYCQDSRKEENVLEVSKIKSSHSIFRTFFEVFNISGRGGVIVYNPFQGLAPNEHQILLILDNLIG